MAEVVVPVSALEAGTVYTEAADRSAQEGMASVAADMAACTVTALLGYRKRHFGLVEPAAD